MRLTSTSGLLLLCACLLLAATTAQAGAVREDIVIVGSDGHTFTVYKTLRSDMAQRLVRLSDGATPADYLYIQPSDFESKVDNQLRIAGGDYALLRTGTLHGQQLTAGADGRVTFHSWDGQVLDNGHFGKWNAPDPFTTFMYVWIAPDNIKILDYQANRDGQWQRTGNVLTWTGHNVNDLTFRVTYQPQTLATASLPAACLATENGATEQRITLSGAVLFAPASHELTDAGLKEIDDLAQRIAQTDPERVVITGHTDSQPVAPYLRDTYPSNWELSAARATNVVRKLIARGVAPTILVARALGAQHPIASNDTAAGRARNRRIGVVLIGVSKTPEAGATN